MSYIVESNASSSRRARRRRALITLSLVTLMLFFAFWYAYSYYRASGEPAAVPAAPCATSTAAAAPRPGETTVNVYNATNRAGLAARTASELRRRGFEVATVSNDPLQRSVAGTAEVRYGRSGTAKAKLVLAHVKGAKAVRDSRTDSSVDFVIGNRFTALAPAPKPKPVVAPPKPAVTKPAAPATPGSAATTPAC